MKDLVQAELVKSALKDPEPPLKGVQSPRRPLGPKGWRCPRGG